MVAHTLACAQACGAVRRILSIMTPVRHDPEVTTWTWVSAPRYHHPGNLSSHESSYLCIMPDTSSCVSYDWLVLMNSVPREPLEGFPQARLLNGASTADPYLALNVNAAWPYLSRTPYKTIEELSFSTPTNLKT